MTEPKPGSQYRAGPTFLDGILSADASPTVAGDYYTNSTASPSGQAIDPMDEFVRWDKLSDEALRLIESQPTLLERVDALEALALDLFKRVQKMEAETWP